MKRTLFILLILSTLFYLPTFAQKEKLPKKNITKNFFVDVGGVYSDFQDTKFSDVRERGWGAYAKIGFNNFKTAKHFWETGLFVSFSKENAATHNQGLATVIYPNIYFKYLKGLNDKLYLGARVDIFDNYIRVYQNLQNNGTFATAGNHFYASVLYQLIINDNWKFRATGDLALISIQNEGTSFTMNYNQNRIEQGGVDYQDPDLGNPGSYKYAEIKYFGNNFILKTEYSFLFKKRFSFSYNWEMRRFATVSGYPTTWGIHNIVVRFNIIHKEK
jgi:hypothetical protein